MRILLVALLLVGCKGSAKKEAPPPVENSNPYKNVMPVKVKKQVEDTQKKEEERGDKVLENAK